MSGQTQMLFIMSRMTKKGFINGLIKNIYFWLSETKILSKLLLYDQKLTEALLFLE